MGTRFELVLDGDDPHRLRAIGEAVLYQHMLLPEGEALTVHLEARRHKQSKRKFE